jgi:hypothetical protein
MWVVGVAPWGLAVAFSTAAVAPGFADPRGPGLPTLRQPPGRVEHPQDFHGLTAHSVRDDVPGLGHYQLPCAVHAHGAAESWLLGQPRNRLEYPLDHETVATESSAAMKEASSSRLRSALRRHLTPIHFPLLRQGSDVLVAGKVACVGFHDSRLDLADVPLVRFDESSIASAARKDLLRCVASARTSRRFLRSSSRRMVMVVDMVDSCLVVHNTCLANSCCGVLGCRKKCEKAGPPIRLQAASVLELAGVVDRPKVVPRCPFRL